MSDITRQERRVKKAKKLKKLRAVIIFIITVILIVFVINYVRGCIALPSKEGKTPADVAGIPIIVDLLPEGVVGRSGQEMKIKHIVIHETGNSGSNANAASHNDYIHKQAETVTLSWHYTVDDHEIYKHLPDNETGYHAGDRDTVDGGNMNGIGIEMCINPENDYEKTLKNTASLVKYLMEEYNLTIDDVKKHQDFSGKVCPEGLITNNRWEEFLSLIENAEY